MKISSYIGAAILSMIICLGLSFLTISGVDLSGDTSSATLLIPFCLFLSAQITVATMYLSNLIRKEKQNEE